MKWNKEMSKALEELRKQLCHARDNDLDLSIKHTISWLWDMLYDIYTNAISQAKQEAVEEIKKELSKKLEKRVEKINKQITKTSSDWEINDWVLWGAKKELESFVMEFSNKLGKI